MSGEGILNQEALLLNNCVLNLPLNSKTSIGKTVTVSGNACLTNAVSSPITSNKTVGYFDGNGDYLSIPDSNDWYFGTNNFTIEFWMMPSGVNASTDLVLYQQRTSVSYYSPVIILQSKKAIRVLLSDGSSWIPTNPAIITGDILSVGYWTHIRLVRYGTVFTLYADGTSVGTVTNSVSLFNNSTIIAIGSTVGESLYDYNGYLSEYRISNIARNTTAFTPQTTPFINDANTVLLLHMDGLNGSTQFIDSSTSLGTTTYDLAPLHGKNITTNGDAKQIFSPLVDSSGICNLNGNGSSYLEILNTAAVTNFGSGNFTIECWIYPLFSGVTKSIIIKRNNYQTDQAWSFNTAGSSAGGLAFYMGNNNPYYINSGTLPIIKTWNHVAVMRLGNQFYLFLNGTIIATKTISADIPTSTANIKVGRATDYPSEDFIGFIKEVRISNIARYATTGFVPQTTKFTSDANTLLLLHFDANGQTFTDSSSYNRTITAYGSAHQVMPPVGKGLAYFDGTGDYLIIGTNTDFAFLHKLGSTGSWSLRFWVKRNTATAGKIISNCTGSSSNGVILTIDNSGYIQLYIFRGIGGTSIFTATSTTYGNVPVDGNWHYCIVNVDMSLLSNNFKAYCDGLLISTESKTSYAASTSTTSEYPLYVGANAYNLGDPLNGYISNLQIFNNIIITDTSIPTVPFQPDPHTKLLLHCDNTVAPTVFKDSSRSVGHNNATVNGTCSIIPIITGSNVMYFNGTTDYLTVSNNIDIQIDYNNQFTFCLWIKQSNTSMKSLFGTIDNSGTVYPGLHCVINNNNVVNNTVFILSHTWYSNAMMIQASTVINDNLWHFLTFVGNGGFDASNYTIYIDSIKQTVSTIYNSLTSTSVSGKPLYVGTGTSSNSYPYIGYMKDFYIFKSVLSQDQIGAMMEATYIQ